MALFANAAQSFAAEFDSLLARKQAKSINAELEEQPSRNSILQPITSAEMLHLLPSDRLKLDQEALPDATWSQPLTGKALIVCEGQENQRLPPINSNGSGFAAKW
jgi:uncharacterized protein with von Willebrand factor type A (vWA) domain